MRKWWRVPAMVLALLLVFSNAGSTVVAYAKDKAVKLTAVGAEEKVLTVTQDMIGANGRLTVEGEWDKIIVPKELEATYIYFKNVKVATIEIESGISSKIEMVSGEIGTVSVVPAQVEEMTVQELAELIRTMEDSSEAIAKYRELKSKSTYYRDTRPTITTRSDVAVSEVKVSGNVKLDLNSGEVENVKVDVGAAETTLNVAIANYEGNVTVKQTDREDGRRTIAKVALRNTMVDTLVVEGETNSNIILSGQNSEVKQAKIESAPKVSVNVATESLEIGKDATDAKITVLADVKEMKVEADAVKVEVGNCGSVSNATVDGDKVEIGGNGILKDVEIKGEGASVSTSGTKVEGENTYVPPVVPSTPSIPETPSEPEIPSEPETPLEPETPSEPENPSTPSFPEDATDASAFEYEILADGSVEITDLIESASVIVIPDEIEGHPVSTLGWGAIMNNNIVEEVYIPGSVKVIDGYAVTYCENLKKIELSEGILVLGGFSFAWNPMLTEVEVPASVEEIDTDTFCENASLKKIEVHKDNGKYCSVDGVLYSKDMTELITVPGGMVAELYEVPEGTEIINGNAFEGCNGIKAIKIPKSLRGGLSSRTFYNCSALERFEVAEDNMLFCETDGILFNKAKTIIVCMPDGTNLTEYEIPSSVTRIGDFAFEGAKSLKKIVVPDSVTYVGLSAFNGCKNLVSMELPDSIMAMSTYIFAECSSLESVKLPTGITEIGYDMFEYCTSLKKFVVPDTVKKIYDRAFMGCTNLECLVIPASVEEIGESAVLKWDAPNLTIYTEEGAYAETYAKEKDIAYGYLEEGTLDIPTTKLVYVETENGTIAITGYKSLASSRLTIPDSIDGKNVTAVSGGAFSGCTNITHVVIADTVEEIGPEAFSECSNLKSVRIPASVTVIAEDAFKGSEFLVIETTYGSTAMYFAIDKYRTWLQIQ